MGQNRGTKFDPVVAILHSGAHSPDKSLAPHPYSLVLVWCGLNGLARARRMQFCALVETSLALVWVAVEQ